MPEIIGIRYKNSNKIYYFNPEGGVYAEGDGVIVETARGLEYAVVAVANKTVDDSEIVQPLKSVQRKATDEDLERVKKNQDDKAEALRVIREKVTEMKLNMKLVDAEYTFDRSKLIFYFTADGRVDFRNLVRDLASSFHTRIELKQIGARDECRMMGGIAPCGRACCCSDHMSDYARVSIKMAKTQSLSLNPAKISGLCGRLMCCLAYENEYYAEVNKAMPKIGGTVTVPSGESGIVTAVNQLKKTVRVKVEDKNKDSITVSDYALDEIKFKPKNQQPQKEADEDETDDISKLGDSAE